MALFNFYPQLPNNSDEYDYMFPWGTDPDMASANLLERSGIQPGASPLGGFAQQLLPGYALLSQLQRTIGGQAAPTSDVTQDVGNFMRQGGGVGDPNVIRGMAGLENRRSMGANNLDIGQESLLNRYSNAGEYNTGEISNLLRTALGSRLAPMLRSGSVMGRTTDDLYRRYRNQVGTPGQDQNRGFFNFLSGKLGGF